MPVWVKGNQCFMVSTTKYDLGAIPGRFDITFNPTLLKPAAQSTLSLIFQPGVVRGFNMYVGENTLNKDVTLSLRHGKWDGDALHPITTTVLFTIPAGESGYFCMNPSLIVESVRTWQARDEIQFKLERVGSPSTGNCRFLTFGVCYEITEEYMLDNDFPPNL